MQARTRELQPQMGLETGAALLPGRGSSATAPTASCYCRLQHHLRPTHHMAKVTQVGCRYKITVKQVQDVGAGTVQMWCRYEILMAAAPSVCEA